MRLNIRHTTRYDYDPPAQRADLRLKLFPSSTANQRAERWCVSVNGQEVKPLFVNAYGDAETVWRSAETQAIIEIVAEGVVETTDAAGVLRKHAEQAKPGMFLRQTTLTAPNAPLAQLARGSIRDTRLDTLHQLCADVREAVDYVQRSTDVNTTAAAALANGKGVCQDHAHVFIAAARTLDIPARYVAGYLSPGFVGRQESHAWAEAHVPDLGWVGFDPANRQSPTEAYVRLCSGLDAADAAPLRGWVSASVKETLAVALDVAPSAEQAQQ
ncbi:MAG: transglutaminase domain-containing protein [Hyphomonadaceae bacterium]